MTGVRKWIYIVAGLAAFAVVCFTVGRTTAPRSSHEVKTVEVEKKKATVATVETATAAITQTRTVTKYVDRIVRMPSGETIETKTATVGATKTEEKTAEAKTTKVAIASEASKSTVDRLATLRPSQPRFSVGVNASIGLDLKPHYGAEIGVRVIGPAWVTLGADLKSRALVLGARAVF